MLIGKRKNIRRLISDKKLTIGTKEAQKAEKERIERLKKKAQQQEMETGHIVLEENENKEIILEVSKMVN